MFSGMSFDFPLDEIFSYATDNLNLFMPVVIAVLAVLFFGLLLDTLIDSIMRIYGRIVAFKRLTTDTESEQDDDSDG